ncbi:hypothetical protein M409DRAFT_24468 [Zasmidium cellare ATCC 36951]|uniref:Uncharacterized protein n=1 Tax=Zasmidium cellare ATCC 36951 TaxID=1080233 RepID=A0A6A6CFR5_ZASCE|nr:uncharacterized protein M409DRAFT_24468 [Zasmidium cellare ATCC 36951]KAF2165080.1 hypothetical protein M409DRAFT_24468 [Zasmidium cellare ATCC 36951]
MRTPYSPLKAQTALSLAQKEGEPEITFGEDNEYYSGMADSLTRNEAKAEAEKDSESDSGGDIIPGPNNRRAPGTSNAVSQKADEDIIETQLHMIHASLLIHKPDGSIKWNAASEINPFISPDSPLYKSGGPVLRVQESLSWTMDIMLCCRARCTFCAQVFGPEDTDQDRRNAAEGAEQVELNGEKSPYRGLPFVHTKDLSKRKGGRLFMPAEGEGEWGLEGVEKTRVIEALFIVASRKTRLRCLACVVDRCQVCKEAKEEADRRVGERRATGPKRKKTVVDDTLDDEIRVGGPGGGARDAAEMEEQVVVDADGGVLREYVSAEASPERPMGGVSSKSKGKRKLMA